MPTRRPLTRAFARALVLALALALPMAATAAPAPKDPKKQTPWGLYLTSQEAHDMKVAEGAKVFVRRCPRPD